MSVEEAAPSTADFAPGTLVQVRDETWVVAAVEHSADGFLISARGVSPLVEGTTAQFYESIDDIVPFRPEETRVVTDSSPHYVQSRLWLESMLRKTSLPVSQQSLAVTPHVLADALAYQREAVERALDPERLRARLLIADTVGLGKTLEIGMILSELIRRGKGRRILVVTPRHVLEQTQHELWTRFALPFVRLDSEGVQRVRQKLPATRNPFTYFEKVIISMDTLKQDRFVQDLRRHHWDAVVIDESHNVTNRSTQNNQLARILAPNTDSLILASATPHNGRNDSFANQLSLLEPSSVGPDGTFEMAAVENLMVRRHRYSESVRDEVGDRWAERQPTHNVLAAPSEEEHAVAVELARTWTHPDSGAPPTPGGGAGKLFAWNLAKAFLSSPVALRDTIEARLKTLEAKEDAEEERAALLRLRGLNEACLPEGIATPRSGKYQALVRQLREQGVSARSPERAVVFAERVPTLGWLRTHLVQDLKLKSAQVQVLHGGLTDMEQQAIVDSFKQASSPIRVLVTGDVASEGVNLHQQCHELIHFDIPWSLIRIEQRNGRIDRYGQQHPPRISTLLLDLQDVEGFTGDIRVLSRLLEREREAHEKLGDVASIMGEYSGKAEEKKIRDVLLGSVSFDEAIPTVEAKLEEENLADPLLAAFLEAFDEDSDENEAEASADLFSDALEEPSEAAVDLDHSGLFSSTSDFLLAGLRAIYTEPGRSPERGGVSLQLEYDQNNEVLQTLTLTPSEDLRQRLSALPQSYVEEREIMERLTLTPEPGVAEESLALARGNTSGSSWPRVHYLAPLHPVLDWLSDRSLAALGRGEVFAVYGEVEVPKVLCMGVITNRRGENISVAFAGVDFTLGQAMTDPFASPRDMFQKVGLSEGITGRPVKDPERYQDLIPQAVDRMRAYMEGVVNGAAASAARERVDRWTERLTRWQEAAQSQKGQAALFKDSRLMVEGEKLLVQEMNPDRTFVRPMLVVLPREGA